MRRRACLQQTTGSDIAHPAMLERPLAGNPAALQQRDSRLAVIWSTDHAAGASVWLVRKSDIRRSRSERLVPVKAAGQNQNFEFPVVNGRSTRRTGHQRKTVE
jgi:hypothetical protein